VSAWADTRAQDGFMLIEVLISALLLGLIAAATVTGLQAVDDGTTNQRFHNEAVLLAAQSQEDMRSSPISSLEKLISHPRSYTDTVDSTNYTIKQEVHELSSKEENTTCSVAEHGAYTAPNFRVTSIVSWHFLKGHPVSESSILTPPTSSSLEVDVDNEPSPTGGVAEVPVDVTHDAYETGTPITVQDSTNSQGCVLFTGIRATSATVEVPEKAKYVTTSGALKLPSAEVSVAPGLATRDAVTFNEGGAIAADFAYQGKAEYEGKRVTGDTFVVANGELGVPPELELGTAGTFSYESGGEEHYTASTGTYGPTGLTAKGARYERGDLFPFTSAWSVYAGDCAANNPSTITKGAVVPGEGIVTSGNTTAVAAPTSLVSLEALEGSEKAPGKTRDAEALHVKITNLSCSAASPAPATPNNAATAIYTHTQKLSGGALEDPFQPFGKFELCVQAVESATEPSKDRVDKRLYENVSLKGAEFKIYPQEKSAEENKAIREAGEATERTTWKTEETEGKITHTQRTQKESTQTTNRTAAETKETTEATENNKAESEGKAQKVETSSKGVKC